MSKFDKISFSAVLAILISAICLGFYYLYTDYKKFEYNFEKEQEQEIIGTAHAQTLTLRERLLLEHYKEVLDKKIEIKKNEKLSDYEKMSLLLKADYIEITLINTLHNKSLQP